MSAEKSDPAGWDGESRWVFATLGSVYSPLHMQMPASKQGGGDDSEKGGRGGGKYKTGGVNKLRLPESITAAERKKNEKVLYQFDSPGAESTGIKSQVEF